MAKSIEEIIKFQNKIQNEFCKAIKEMIQEFHLDGDVIRTDSGQKGILKIHKVYNELIPEVRFYPYRKSDGELSDRFVHLWVFEPTKTQSWLESLLESYEPATK